MGPANRGYSDRMLECHWPKLIGQQRIHAMFGDLGSTEPKDAHS